MSLIGLLIVVIVAGLIWYLVNLSPLASPFKQIAQVILIIIAIIWLVGFLPSAPHLIALR